MFCISEKNKPVSPVCRAEVLKEKQFIIRVMRMFSLIPLCESCVIILHHDRCSVCMHTRKIPIVSSEIWICTHIFFLVPPQQIWKSLLIFLWPTRGKNKQIKAEIAVKKTAHTPLPCSVKFLTDGENVSMRMSAANRRVCVVHNNHSDNLTVKEEISICIVGCQYSRLAPLCPVREKSHLINPPGSMSCD